MTNTSHTFQKDVLSVCVCVCVGRSLVFSTQGYNSYEGMGHC